ncbi:zinc finger protein 862-like [Ptychodera flava]|uniref:zinc finger protein 862-like n=1 Tax=Ptychodera flava TaxID=63121 RepID=UPI00396A3CE9
MARRSILVQVVATRLTIFFPSTIIIFDCRAAFARPSLQEDMKSATTTAYGKIKDTTVALMRTVFTMAKEQISNRKLPALIDMQISNGCQALNPLQDGSSQLQYTHHESLDDFFLSIRTVIERQILSNVKNCPFKIYAAQLDEATDVSNLSTVMVYIRFVNCDGNVESHFLSVKELSACSAGEIYNAVSLLLADKDLDVGNLICISTDGASVMRGQKSGVTTRFKDVNPYLVANHCLAHRLALASEKAANMVPYLVKYIRDLNQMGKLLKFSPKLLRILEAAKVHHGEAKAKKIKQVFFTRWLSFNDCVEALVGCIDSVIAWLVQISEERAHKAIASGLLKRVGTYQFIAMTYFSADAIGLLAKLCKAMQTETAVYSDLKTQVDGTVLALQTLLTVDGPNYEEFLKCVPSVPSSEGKSLFKSQEIRDTISEREKFQANKIRFTEELVQHLQTWFPDSGLMDSFCVLDPQKLPDSPDSQYGLPQLQSIVDHFGVQKTDKEGKIHQPIINATDCKLEWAIVKSMMLKNKTMDTQSFFREVLNKQREVYPNMCMLYALALTCPVTSVSCERGFSQYNLIKTAHRNLLTVTHVNDLAMISVEGPHMHKFDFDAAFEVWINMKKRLGFANMVKKVRNSEGVDDDTFENIQVQLDRMSQQICALEKDQL